MLNQLKKKAIVLLIGLICAFNQGLFASVPSSKEFFLITIPKSGTHLSVKLLLMLTGRNCDPLLAYANVIPHISDEEFAQIMETYWLNHFFVFQHMDPLTYGSKLETFASTHPNYIKILQVRDLRDCLVSYIYHMKQLELELDLQSRVGEEPTFDALLTHVLNKTDELAWGWEDIIKFAIEWQNKPDTVILRFEELIGDKGGGSDLAQEGAIRALASQLDIPLTDEHLSCIQENLFGNQTFPSVSVTFRSGQIGSWKEHFTPHQIELFKKNWGHYQVQLGYPLD
ncbi:sulfotransferase domain-containing protein [Candidatus Protochlamydia phocaeensis]|uniref:sulfotransferase domain-containing protein n=1 Tax=Candidatus Protochlamydia phocaeensis TaxID=1414722 RepID=UPI0008390513|nr:sulfotransferase domain-containing protein [Candidatus Protochlamydia phocaeensis]